MATRVRSNQTITLARALSKFGIRSRAQARVDVAGGKVSVNGKVTTNPDFWVNPRTDRIAFEGVRIMKPEFLYIALNKPPGFVTTRSDERGRKTVYALLPGKFHQLFPVGRLDKESSGLLFFTNDTQFGETVTSPRSHVGKRYIVTLNMPLRAPDRQCIEGGMTLEDSTTLMGVPVTAVRGDLPMYELELHEGKNRQIRRMFKTLGYDVVALKRIAVGAVTLGSLGEGEVRALAPTEVELFLRQNRRLESPPQRTKKRK